MNRISNEPPSEIVPLAKIQYESPPKALRKNIDIAKAALKEHGQVKVILILSTSRPHIASRKRPKPLPPPDGKLGMFTVRSGSVQLEAARELKWKEIKAIVIPEECPTPSIIPEWVKLLEQHTTNPLSDYEIAQSAVDMETKFQVKGSLFATITGISKPYIYNLMRWYRHAPPQVREAWKEKHPLINQAELEFYSHMSSSEDALRAWKSRVMTKSSNAQPFKPGRNGYARKEDIECRPRRASEKQITLLQESINQSNLSAPAKELCSHIIKFVLGARKDVPGVTRKAKLHPSITTEDSPSA